MPANNPGRELRPFERIAAEVVQRMVQEEVPAPCSFDGGRGKVRVPATRLGSGFIAECEHTAVMGTSAAEGAPTRTVLWGLGRGLSEIGAAWSMFWGAGFTALGRFG